MVERSTAKIVEDFHAILTKYGIDVDKIVLYGSYAKGRNHEDNDIDVAVVSRDFGKDRTEEGMLLFRLAGELDSRLEPVPISLDSYEHDTWNPLIYEIKENGVEIPLKETYQDP